MVYSKIRWKASYLLLKNENSYSIERIKISGLQNILDLNAFKEYPSRGRIRDTVPVLEISLAYGWARDGTDSPSFFFVPVPLVPRNNHAGQSSRRAGQSRESRHI